MGHVAVFMNGWMFTIKKKKKHKTLYYLVRRYSRREWKSEKTCSPRNGRARSRSVRRPDGLTRPVFSAVRPGSVFTNRNPIRSFGYAHRPTRHNRYSHYNRWNGLNWNFSVPRTAFFQNWKLTTFTQRAWYIEMYRNNDIFWYIYQSN